jgi:hypothetical protein
MDIPIKYILEKGFHEVGHYFEELLRNKRLINNKVAVYYTDINESLLFVPCDIFGYPKIRYYEFITLMGFPKLMSFDELAIPEITTTVYKKCVEIREPEIFYKVASGNSIYGDNYFFMWKGEIRDKQEIPIDQLDVKYLMQLAQEAIKKREPIIIDEVIKNKLFK